MGDYVYGDSDGVDDLYQEGYPGDAGGHRAPRPPIANPGEPDHSAPTPAAPTRRGPDRPDQR